MKITREVEKTQFVTETVDVLCNRCGQSCVARVSDGSGGTIDAGAHGLIETAVSGGYHSPVLPDGINFTFSICEPCLGLLFSEFKLPPVHTVWLGYPVSIAWIDGKPAINHIPGNESDDDP